MTATTCQPPPWAFFWMKGDRSGGRRGRRGRHHHGPPPWVEEMFGRRQQRAERGDVRLLILDAIDQQPRHGYEIIQVIGERTGGNYQPSPGTVYPTLQMLEEMGHATSSEEEGRRVYAITEAGREELEAHRHEVDDAYDRLGGSYEWFDMPELIDMFRHFGKMMRALSRAFRRGWLEPQQVRDLKAIMDDAIERIQDVISGRHDGD